MKKLFITFTIFLVMKRVVSLNSLTNYNEEYDCEQIKQGYWIHLRCLSTLPNLESSDSNISNGYFEIQYMPFYNVFIYCYDDPDTSDFNYNISFLVHNVHSLKLINCNLRKYTTSFSNSVFRRMPKLIELTLDNNGIRELQPHVFDDFTQLEKLSFSENRLNSLPNDIFANLTNLKLLDMSMNNLSSLQMDLFKYDQSGTFMNLNNLLELRLCRNKLENLPENIFRGLNQLLSLELCKNLLSFLPDNLFNGLHNLRALDLTNNRLRTISSSLLTGLNSLKYFEAGYNEIESIDESAFATLSNLFFVDLTNNKITTLERTTNPNIQTHNRKLSIFSSNLKLDELILSYNQISDIYDDWANVLLDLRVLDLSCNNITRLSWHVTRRVHRDHFAVNLSHNKIKTIDLSLLEKNFIVSSKRLIILWNVTDNPIVCDASIYDFLRYLDDSMSSDVTYHVFIEGRNLTCLSPEEHRGTRLTDLRSKTFKTSIGDLKMQGECPKFCSYHVIPFNKTLAIDCPNKNLTESPEITCHVDGLNSKLEGSELNQDNTSQLSSEQQV